MWTHLGVGKHSMRYRIRRAGSEIPKPARRQEPSGAQTLISRHHWLPQKNQEQIGAQGLHLAWGWEEMGYSDWSQGDSSWLNRWQSWTWVELVVVISGSTERLSRVIRLAAL